MTNLSTRAQAIIDAIDAADEVFSHGGTIREGEDFLPKQDPLMNYRIKKVTKPDGKVWYYPQKKFLWFWISIDNSGGYGIESWAQAAIFADYYKTQKDKVEYLPADNSKLEEGWVLGGKT